MKISLGIYLSIALSHLLLMQSPLIYCQCGISVKEFKTQTLFGKNIGFYVVFANSSGKTVDAIKFNVDFKDGFDEVMESKNFIWQSGNIDKPFVTGDTKMDIEKAWINGANKISIKVIRVHYTNGTSCINNDETSFNPIIETVVDDAKNKFKNYIPKIDSTNGAIVSYWKSYTGDFTGDGLDDVVIFFGLTPADGGSANVGQGLVFYSNMGTYAKVQAGYQPQEPFNFSRIEHNKIYVTSNQYKKQLTVLGNKVIEKIIN